MEQFSLTDDLEPVRQRSQSSSFPAALLLGGGLAAIGSGFAGTEAPDVHFAVPQSEYFAWQSVKPAPMTSVLEGRITGPVRLIQQVARAWSLSAQDLAALLAYPSERFAEDLLSGRLSFDTSEVDRADRVRLIYAIHATLSDLFVDAGDEERWIRTRAQEFGDASPLDYMVRHRIPAMVAVRQFVEQRLANR